MTEDEQFAHFETMGVAHVRDMALQWQGPMQALAYKWLRRKDQEARRLNEASQAEQIEIARSAKDAAWEAARAAKIANKIAVAALIAAAVAIIVSIISLARSH